MTKSNSQPLPQQPVLYLMVGLPGSGKTTRAKEIEVEHNALRLSPDEWILDLYGHDLDRPQRDAVRDPVEALQWKVAQRAIGLGCSVVLDWGFWSQEERRSYGAQGEQLGATVQVIFLDAEIDELWARISQRDGSQQGTRHISREELEEWSTWFEPLTDESV